MLPFVSQFKIGHLCVARKINHDRFRDGTGHKYIISNCVRPEMVDFGSCSRLSAGFHIEFNLRLVFSKPQRIRNSRRSLCYVEDFESARTPAGAERCRFWTDTSRLLKNKHRDLSQGRSRPGDRRRSSATSRIDRRRERRIRARGAFFQQPAKWIH